MFSQLSFSSLFSFLFQINLPGKVNFVCIFGWFSGPDYTRCSGVDKSKVIVAISEGKIDFQMKFVRWRLPMFDFGIKTSKRKFHNFGVKKKVYEIYENFKTAGEFFIKVVNSIRLGFLKLIHYRTSNLTRFVFPTASGVQKYRRKEVWEKLRKRQNNSKINLSNNNGSQSSPSESHIRRSNFRNPSISVESSSDPDLTVFRTERPTCLPFASSLSPESSRETLPSPSATSLKLHMEPSELAHELSGKSSSAPLLVLKHAGSASSAVPSTKKKVTY